MLAAMSFQVIGVPSDHLALGFRCQVTTCLPLTVADEASSRNALLGFWTP